MRCPSCGFENLEETRFCIKCGVPLKNRCPGCGAENPLQAKFCGDCGTSLTRQSPASKPKSKIRCTALWVYGTAGGLIVLALLIGGLWYRSQQQAEDGTRREVSLGIAYGGREGEGSTSYQAWSKGGGEARVKAEKEEKDRTLSPPSPEEKRREEEANRLALIRERSKKPLELLTIRFLNTNKVGKPLSAPAETFPASKTRFIAWEVVFRNRLQDLIPAYHRVEGTYYGPNGRLLGTVQDGKEVPASAAEATFTARLGNSSGGAFVLGTYRVDFYVDGRLLTSRQFQVKDDR